MKSNIVGVVLLTYNSAAYIIPCIRSVQKNNYRNFTLLIVDNNSSDNTVDLVKKNFPKIKIIRNSVNSGFAVGNNIGIKYFVKKQADFILCLNPDTIVSYKLISTYVKAFLSKQSIGVVGSYITYLDDPQKIWFGGGLVNKFFLVTKHAFMNQKLSKSNLISRQVDFVTGASIMLRASILEKTKLFPEQYFMYFEDVFFCAEVIKKKFLCYVIGEPLVRHKVSYVSGVAGTNQLTPLRAYYYARNPWFYIHRNVKGGYKLSNYIGQLFIRLPYYVGHLIFNKNLTSLIWYFRGLKDGITMSFRRRPESRNKTHGSRTKFGMTHT